MKACVVLMMVLALAACATCKSSDTAEQCRTKERDHGHPRISVFVLTQFPV